MSIKETFDKIKVRYPVGAESSLVLPLLHAVQNENGYITDEDILEVANCAGVPAIQVEEAVSWYHMLTKKKKGKYHIKFCRNIVCSMRGAENMVEYVSKKLGIKPGETTPDGKFCLSLVECLASCGTAPVMQLNKTYHEDLTLEKVDAILAELK
ncbi:NAD(P)H-dependent oxidoreductase subunit E [Deltaproteobacteria bacterium TL4]